MAENEELQELLGQAEEMIGRGLVKSAVKAVFKKGVDFILPGFDMAFSTVDRIHSVVPEKAVQTEEGDGIVVTALAHTVGRQSDDTLEAIKERNCMQKFDKWLNKIVRTPGRACGSLMRRAVTDGLVKPAGKAFCLQTTLDIMEYIQEHPMQFGSGLHNSLLELCSKIDLETADARAAYLAEIERKQEEEKARLKVS